MESFKHCFHIDEQYEVTEDRDGKIIVTTPEKVVQLKYSAEVHSLVKSFPVILKDLGTGSVLLRKLKPTTKLPFHGVVGDVDSINNLSSGDWLVRCRSELQQHKLLSLTHLAGVDIKCHVPTPTTQGVIYGLDDTSVLEYIPIISKWQILQGKGKASKCTRIIFLQDVLPEFLQVGRRRFKIHPYVPPVKRCTKCQRLNHGLKQCKAKHPRCCRCGKQHVRADCHASHPFCVNCQGHHSAAYRECPKQKEIRSALRLKSTKFMTLAEALKAVSGQPRQQIRPKSFSQALKEGRQIPDGDTFVRQSVLPILDAASSPDKDIIQSISLVYFQNHGVHMPSLGEDLHEQLQSIVEGFQARVSSSSTSIVSASSSLYAYETAMSSLSESEDEEMVLEESPGVLKDSIALSPLQKSESSE